MTSWLMMSWPRTGSVMAGFLWVELLVTSGVPSQRASHAELVFSLLLAWSCVTNNEVAGDLCIITPSLGHYDSGVWQWFGLHWSCWCLVNASASAVSWRINQDCRFILITVYMYFRLLVVGLLTMSFLYMLCICRCFGPIGSQYPQIQGWLTFRGVILNVFVRVNLWWVMWTPGQLLLPYLWLEWRFAA